MNTYMLVVSTGTAATLPVEIKFVCTWPLYDPMHSLDQGSATYSLLYPSEIGSGPHFTKGTPMLSYLVKYEIWNCARAS